MGPLLPIWLLHLNSWLISSAVHDPDLGVIGAVGALIATFFPAFFVILICQRFSQVLLSWQLLLERFVTCILFIAVHFENCLCSQLLHYQVHVSSPLHLLLGVKFDLSFEGILFGVVAFHVLLPLLLHDCRRLLLLEFLTSLFYLLSCARVMTAVILLQCY